MKTVHKQRLDKVISLPADYYIIHVGIQDNKPTIWYECDPELVNTVFVKFEIIGTGIRFQKDTGIYTLILKGSLSGISTWRIDCNGYRPN